MSWETPSGDFGVRPIGVDRPRTGIRLALALLAGMLPLLAGFVLNNYVVSRSEAVDAAWAQVESAYQRRADLVPRLVEVVKRHLRQESETLVAVVEARSRAGSALAGTPKSEADISRLGRAQGELGQGLAHLVAVAESHPELRSADSFLELQAQLEGAENRIHVARIAYNDAVRAYNAAIQQLPAAWLAEAHGYQRRAYFESNEGAERAGPLGLD